MKNRLNTMPGFKESGKILVRGITKYLHRVTASYLKAKKIKPDRIAALRKQYEEFLEGDKKRKERNEFILGRLDKMRSTSLVPLKQADALQERPLFRPAPIYQGSLMNKPQGNELQNIGNQQNIVANLGIAGSALLEEIGKKYILIPRSSPAVTEYTNKAEVTDDTAEKENNDWKSKYHILDELKKADKEGLEPNSKNDHFPIKEHQLSFRSQNDDLLLQEKGHNQEPTLKYKEEVQEKETFYKQADYGIHNYPENPLENSENKKYTIQNNNQDWGLPVDNNPKKLHETQNTAEKEMENGKASHRFMPLYSSQNKLGYRVTDDYVNQDTHDSNLTETLNAAECKTTGEASAIISNEDAKIDNSGYQKIANPQVTYETYESHEGKYKDVQEVDYRVENQPVIQDVKIGEAKDEDYQYPLEAINTQEFTPDEGVILKDGVNINPEGYTLNENYVDPSVAYVSDSHLDTTQNVANPELATDTGPHPAPIKENEVPPPVSEDDTKEPVVQNFNTEEIREFEEEQANMFYQEIQEPDAAYDQPTNYAQNPNESYQYYEGAEQEQYNPVQINEHEEATERYDPSYQAQYEQNQYDYTQQGYEQQGYEQQDYAEHEHEQPVQEYSAPLDGFGEPVAAYNINQYPQQYDETYDVPHEQGYDVQAEGQQLDHEEGYIDTEHEKTETKAVEKEQQNS